MRKSILILQILFVSLTMMGQGFTDPEFYGLDFAPSDEDHLARILTAECSICNEEELMLVGSTVLNRVDSENFPNTVLEVIQQPNQFHGYKSQWYITTPRSLRAARRLLKGESRNYEVLYFHTNDCPCQEFADSIKDEIIVKLKYHTYAKGS